MWYFSWILGVGVALGFGIINVMWLEANGKLMHDTDSRKAHGAAGTPTDPPSA
jgi:cytochrome bd-I ubiquinol oxidase subunit X